MKEVTFDPNKADPLGFDWMLGPSEEEPKGKGQTERVGSKMRAVKNYVAMLEEFSRSPREIKPEPPAKRSIAGVFTDPQFQMVIRALSKTKGMEMTSLPSVMTRSKQPVMVQMGDRRYGVIATLGADGFPLDLRLFVAPPREVLF